MSPITKKWGIAGAVTLTILGGLLVIVELSLPYNTSELVKMTFRNIVRNGICYPVRVSWEALLDIFDVKGDRMGYIMPILATVPVYLSCVGFCFGVILKKIVKGNT